MYHVVLDLTGGEVKQLKQLALKRDTSVKGLVTHLVVEAIRKEADEKKVDPSSR